MNERELKCYIVLYDLLAPAKDYAKLVNAMHEFPNWGRLTETTWAILTDKSAVEVRDTLQNYVGYNDHLIVIRSGKEAAWVKTLADNDWVKRALVK